MSPYLLPEVEAAPDEEFKIIKNKKFSMNPMTA